MSKKDIYECYEWLEKANGDKKLNDYYSGILDAAKMIIREITGSEMLTEKN